MLTDRLMNLDLSHINLDRIPAHIAIIMDGNGRWAKAQGMERSAGHAEGVKTVRRITEAASEIGVKYLTLYTFSTENWNRPQSEVDTLMNLIALSIERETPDLIKNNVRLSLIGDLERLPEFARDKLEGSLHDTAHCTGLVLNLAISYSARWEITRACRQLARECADGELNPEQINDELFSHNLTTAAMPDPDLLIRTGGDFRVSNFMLWQIAYSEIIVSDKFWPDYTKQDFINDIAAFQARERRFGKTSEQIQNS